MGMNLIKIVFSSDNNFVEQLAVAICSILINSTPDENFKFYILDGGITAKNKEQIKYLKKIKDFQLEFVEINQEDFKDCPISKHFKLPTYFRLKLPTLLSEDKILYMDCDIIVLKSIKELFDIDLDKFYCACVEDFTNIFHSTKQHAQCLGVNRYFNAGIALFNLKKMKNDRIEEKNFEFIKKSPEKIRNVDQCVLNHVFKEKILFVDKFWNFQYNNAIRDINCQFFKNYKNIKILHFACGNKPWTFKSIHPATLLWYYYLAKTPFKKSFLWVLLNILKCTIKKIIITFHIATSIF